MECGNRDERAKAPDPWLLAGHGVDCSSIDPQCQQHTVCSPYTSANDLIST